MLYGSVIPFLMTGRGGPSPLSGNKKGIVRTAISTMVLHFSVQQARCFSSVAKEDAQSVAEAGDVSSSGSRVFSRQLSVS